jgi:hypothetical protein
LGVQVIDNLAYVADGGDGLRIVDIFDPTDPVEIGRDTAGTAIDVQVVDSLAYVAGGGDGFRIIDIYDSTNPVEIACLGTQYPVKRVHVVDSLAYVGCYYYEYDDEWRQDIIRGSLRIINVSDPSVPVEVGCLTNLDIGAVSDVQVVDSLAYVRCFDYGSDGWGRAFLRIINVSDPTNPIEIGYSDEISGSVVYIVDTLAYVGGGQIIDISDPTNPIKVGEYSGGNGIHVVDDLLYVAKGGNAGLRVIDISDPTNPEEIGFYEMVGGANDVYVIEYLAYVATDENGLYIIRCKGESEVVEGGVPPVNIDSEIKIKYFLAKSERVKVEIYNVLGQKMEKLIDETSPPGEYNLSWEGNEGIYFVRVEIGDKVYKKKTIIVR